MSKVRKYNRDVLGQFASAGGPTARKVKAPASGKTVRIEASPPGPAGTGKKTKRLYPVPGNPTVKVSSRERARRIKEGRWH